MSHLAFRRMAYRIVTMAVLFGLTAACGLKGPLYLPPPGPVDKDAAKARSPAPAANSVPVPPQPSPSPTLTPSQ